MREELVERLVISFERLALAVEGLRDEAKKAGLKYWPPQKEQREPILTRNEGDKEKEVRNQGARMRTVQDAVDPEKDDDLEEEDIGPRARQWMKDHPQEKKVPTPSGDELL
jgi:hypothetical protein